MSLCDRLTQVTEMERVMGRHFPDTSYFVKLTSLDPPRFSRGLHGARAGGEGFPAERALFLRGPSSQSLGAGLFLLVKKCLLWETTASSQCHCLFVSGRWNMGSLTLTSLNIFIFLVTPVVQDRNIVFHGMGR